MNQTSTFAALPARIRTFLHEHHVVGLATLFQGEPWAASCFYVFDEATMSLIILSAESTRHGAAMLEHPVIAGTIAGQPTFIPQIRGIQFQACAHLLTGNAGDAAYALYCQRHPIARLKRSAVWRLQLQELKFTDNSRIMGNKTLWQRNQ